MGAAALFSTGGAAIKAWALSGWQVACLRSGVAAVAVLLLLPAARRGWTRHTAAVGGVYAATLILFVLANKLTTAASTIFLQSTAPLYLLLLGPWILREPVRRRDLGFMAALALGMSMFFVGTDPARATAPHPLAGNILGAASGLSYAVTVTGLRWAARKDSLERGGATGSAAAVVLAGNAMTFLACLPMSLPFAGVRPIDVAVLGYLGVFQIALAYALLTRGMQQVPALEAALLLLVEPILNPVWAWIVQGETVGPWSLAGGLVILAATALRTWIE